MRYSGGVLRDIQKAVRGVPKVIWDARGVVVGGCSFIWTENRQSMDRAWAEQGRKWQSMGKELAKQDRAWQIMGKEWIEGKRGVKKRPSLDGDARRMV